MSDILKSISAYKLEEIAAAKARQPLEAVEAAARSAPPVRPFAGALEARTKTGGFALIAEIKKATPSKGRLVATLEHRALARTYTIGGACAISILTESKYFQGSIDFLSDCRVSIDGYYPGGRPAMLRKDFIFDAYQVWESRAYGADALLLIVSILTDDELRELTQLAHELQMECLVEVASEDEVQRALRVDADVIGINNRDLRTFEVDLAVTERLQPLIPNDKVVAALSGVHTRADAERMAKAGAHAVLVGEALMTASDVREKMREYLF